MENGGVNIGAGAEAFGGSADGGGHGDDVVTGCSVSGEEYAETAVVDREVADVLGMVWEGVGGEEVLQKCVDDVVNTQSE